MKKYQCEDEIRKRVDEFNKKLEQHGFELVESMVRDYMIKYQVFEDKLLKGTLVVYFKKKENRENIKNENLEEDCFTNILKIIYDMKEEKTSDFTLLDKYYYILKKYRDKNFDFSVFAEKLCEYLDSDKENILKHRYNFDELERIYFKLKKL